MKTINFLLVMVIIVAYNSMSAQWNINTQLNTTVCNEFGKQGDPRIIKGINGGAYIAWKDWRNGLPDIFLQRINQKGEKLWVINGLNMCTDAADQSTPNLIKDNKGGVILTWSDWRSGIERDIFAQKVDSNGLIKWAFNGVPVTDKNAREHNEKIVDDDNGGAIIIWEQQSGPGWDVWGQHIDSNGNRLWTNGGKALCSVYGNRLNPKVQADGKGGAIVVWQDERIVGDYNIFAQRVDAAGNLLWGNNALQITNASNVQIDPKIDPDESIGGVYIAWIDKRNGVDYDVYAHRVDSAGNLLWPANGVALAATNGNQSAQDILSNNSTNGLIATWKDNRNGSYDIYAQKLNKNGIAQWATNGVVINNNANDQLNPNICEDNVGGAIIAFHDKSGVDINIVTQRVDSMGILIWPSAGVIVSDAVGDQENPKNMPDGSSGTIVVWEDDRIVGDRNIFMHHIGANGTSWPLSIDLNNSNTTLKCYPNPCFNTLTIENFEAENIFVKDIFGRNVSVKIIQKFNHSITIDFAALSYGMYLISDGEGHSVKVVKEH